MSILCEQRTLLFHLSGIIVGIILAVSRQRFPGVGFVLGGRQSQSGFEPWTRSWGYGRRPRPVYPSPRQPGTPGSSFHMFLSTYSLF